MTHHLPEPDKLLCSATYLTGASDPKNLPHPQFPELLFIGRSNAGKSSVINTLLNQRIARTSRTPGRTQQIHFFQVQSGACLVDCPGYGFAQVSQKIKAQWPTLIKACLARPNLKGIIWIMDIRRPLQPTDLEVKTSLLPSQCPIHIILNKADKINRQTMHKTLKNTQDHIRQWQNPQPISLQVYSALKKTGIHDCQKQISQWLHNET